METCKKKFSQALCASRIENLKKGDLRQRAFLGRRRHIPSKYLSVKSSIKLKHSFFLNFLLDFKNFD